MGLVLFPRFLLEQRRPRDENSVHNQKSSAKSFANWYFEPEEEVEEGEAPQLLHKIKTIKAMESGINFQDVFSLSLSIALHRHFHEAEKSASAQPWITLGFAKQPGGAAKDVDLTNNCVYNFERVPLIAGITTREDLSVALKEVRRVRVATAAFEPLHSGLLVFFSRLPECFSKKLLQKSKCSIGVSNIPGPSEGISLGDEFRVKFMTFTMPNRYRTRLSVSMFSLENRLHLSVCGDEISFAKDAQEESGRILESVVEEIDRMYRIVIG